MSERRHRITLICGGLMLLWLSVVPGGAGFEEGDRAYKSGDYATALREWLPLAQQGDATAQFNLGYIYARGQGMPQDYTQAVQWYQRAAEQGDAHAQTMLGVLYAKRKGVPQDYSV